MRLTYFAKGPVTVDGVALPAGTYNGRRGVVFTFSGGEDAKPQSNGEFTLLLSQSELDKLPGLKTIGERELIATSNVEDGSLVVI